MENNSIAACSIELLEMVSFTEKKSPLESILICDICGENYCNRKQLVKHITRHLNSSILFTCDFCQKSFTKHSSLEKHMTKHLGAHCQHCKKNFKTNQEFFKHCCVAQRETVFACDFCKRIFVKKSTLKRHIRMYDCSYRAKSYWLKAMKENGWICRVCRKDFSSESELSMHFKGRHSGKPIQCQWCPKKFDRFACLEKHLRVCGKLFCPICNHGLSTKEGLKRHQEKHLNTEVKCGVCEKPFLSEKIKSKHEGSCKRKRKSRNLNWSGGKYIVKKVRRSVEEVTLRPIETEKPVILDKDLEERKGWFDEYYADLDTVENNVDSDVDLGRVLDGDTVEDSDTNEESDVGVAEDFDLDYKKCRLCRSKFQHEYELLHHFIKVHPEKIPHQCPRCDRKYPLFAQLKEHMKDHGIGLGVHHCGYCSKAFSKSAMLEKHSKKCQSGAVWPGSKTCKDCGKVLQTKCGFKNHKKFCKKKERGKLSVPDDDGETFKTDERKDCFAEPPALVADEIEVLAGDLEAASPDPRDDDEEEENTPQLSKGAYMRCRFCETDFPSERALVMHFRKAHPGLKPLLCPYCGAELAEKLKEHLKTHGIGEEFICALCDKRFNQKFLSKVHELWHEGIEYKCHTCSQKFLSQEKMERHIASKKCQERESMATLPCEECGKTFKSRYGLKLHQVMHTPLEMRASKNQFSCEYCGKWFANKNALLRHTRTHTGEKPYCCRFCPKAFAQIGNCRAHERTHTGEGKRKRKSAAPPESTPMNVIIYAVSATGITNIAWPGLGYTDLYVVLPQSSVLREIFIGVHTKGFIVIFYDYTTRDNMNLYNWFCVLTTLCSSQMTANASQKKSSIVFPDEGGTTTTTPGPIQEIPLELGLRLSNVTDVDYLFTNFIDNNDSPVLVAARFGPSLERKAFKAAKMAACIPEQTTVSLVPNGKDASTYYFPQCTRVARCGGCCNHDLLACQPTEVEILQLGVVITEYRGGDQLVFKGRDIVSVEQHKACKCDCKIKETDCTAYQKYNKAACRCECNNRDKQEKCREESATKLWNPQECACVCRDTLDCPSGFYFNRFSCECVPERPRPLRPNTTGFDRYNYNFDGN